MMSAPEARTSSGRIALTVAAVPTGMNAGVRISPRGMTITPVRAAPSVAAIEKAKPVMVVRLAALVGGQQQTRVAVRIEAVALFDRMRVRRLHDVEAHQRADQHEQGRFRQME